MPAHSAQDTRYYCSSSTAHSTSATALVGLVTGFSGPDGQAADIDVTSFDSTAREYLAGLSEEGNISLDINSYPSDLGQLEMRDAKATRDMRSMTIKLTDTSTTTLVFDGYVKSFAMTGAVDDKVTISSVIRISGAVTWTTA